MAFTLTTPEQRANYYRNTRNLEPGHYVTTNGFFWHDIDVHILAGPFTTQRDALVCRDALEDARLVAGSYWVDQVADPDNITIAEAEAEQ